MTRQSNWTIAYGSSGNFFAQIGNRAPFDVFLSADVEYPRKLAAAGYRAGEFGVHVRGGTTRGVGAGRFSTRPGNALRDPAVKHVAIANPQHAPYGRAAEAALRRSGAIPERGSRNWCSARTSRRRFSLWRAAPPTSGIVALSLALAPPVRARGRYWEIPLDAYPRMEQGGIILKDSKAARDFRAFLLSADGRRILKQYGFFVPGE